MAAQVDGNQRHGHADSRAAAQPAASAASGVRPALSVDHATTPGGRSPAPLRDVCLEVAADGVVCIVGSEAAERSALADLLSLAEVPARGRVTTFGEDVAARPASQRAAVRQRIGVIAADDRLMDHLSVFENVALPLRIAGRPKAAWDREVRELLTWLDLGGRLEALPSDLTAEERRLVAVARAVVTRPDLIIADSWEQRLGSDVSKRVGMLLHELNRHGTAVVLISADAGLARSFGVAPLRLAHGRLLADSPERTGGDGGVGDRRPVRPPRRQASTPGRDPLRVAGVFWMTALLAWVGVVALAGVVPRHASVQPWPHAAGERMTIQIPAGVDADDGAGRLQAVIDVLQASPDVASAQAVPEAEVRATLEPWFGDAERLEELPLPLVVDVAMRPDASADRASLLARLRGAAPDATADMHPRPARKSPSIGYSSPAISAVLGLALCAAAIGAAAFATRAALRRHAYALETLRRLGAAPSFVAAPLTRRALADGALGGVAGAVLAVVSMVGVVAVPRMLGSGEPIATPSSAQWIVAASVPVGLAILAALTTRIAVVRFWTRTP